jgi:hypothetical protein
LRYCHRKRAAEAHRAGLREGIARVGEAEAGLARRSHLKIYLALQEGVLPRLGQEGATEADTGSEG